MFITQEKCSLTCTVVKVNVIQSVHARLKRLENNVLYFMNWIAVKATFSVMAKLTVIAA